MLLGIVSDTHGHVEYTRQAVRMLKSLEAREVKRRHALCCKLET